MTARGAQDVDMPIPPGAADAAGGWRGKSPLQHVVAYTLVAGVLLCLFIATAVVRRLNFDESLALRAGWLLVEGISGGPAFYMPFTMALGVLGHLVQDPAAVFTVARVGVALGLMAAVTGAAWSQLPRWDVLALTVALSLGHYTFTTHGLEFRYDWAIQVALIVAYAALLRPSRAGQIVVGLCCAWLSFHHLKGVYYAGVVYVLALANAASQPHARTEMLVGLHLGGAAGLAAWLGLSAATGHLEDLGAMYATFFELASDSTRGSRWETLDTAVRADAIWYALTTPVVLWQLRAALKARDGLASRRILLLVGLIAATLLFLLVHPRPWPYLMAMPAPLIAMIVSEGAVGPLAKVPLRYVVYAALVGATLNIAAGYDIKEMSYVKSLQHTRERQVESLRALKGLAQPDDRILDPSGLAYFVRPVHPEWYIDRLFMDQATAGRWMAGVEDDIPEGCRFILYTYRLQMLPRRVRDKLGDGYKRMGGGIGLATWDPLSEQRIFAPELPIGPLQSHW